MYKFLHDCMFLIFLDVYSGVELLGCMSTLRLTFWETAKLFSTEAVAFNIPTSNEWGFQFLYILPTLGIFCY